MGKEGNFFAQNYVYLYEQDKNEERRIKMRLKQKMAILALAVLLTFVGFSLISSPAQELVQLGKEAGYEIMSNFLTKAEAAHHSNSYGG